MLEDDILLNENPLDLLKTLFKDGIIDELNEGNYKINYFGEKSEKYLESLIKYYQINDNNIEKVKNILKNKEDERNYIIYIKYKDIYIGGLSIFDFKSREGFGLNKYLDNKESSFYIGEWKENQKNGIGFLKIDDNHLYFGNFKENQLNDNGLYLNKDSENFFYGLFNNGDFKQGLYINLNKDIYYFGKFINGKKNDDFSVYINYKKNRIFIGQIQNDIFINGYVIILKIEETKNNIILKIRNIVYRDKDKYIPIKIKNNKNLEIFIYIVPKIVNQLKMIFENFEESLSELENIYNDNTYNNRIGRYNSTENSFSFKEEIFENYNQYSDMFNDILKEINIDYLKNKIPLL